ncbi:MAG: glycosyltransferase family 4 protein [Acidimicrobiales bacterium]
MKIVHLTTVASSHRYLLLPQLVALSRAGHEVVAVSAPGSDTAALERRGIRFVPLPGSTRGVDPAADLRAARSFAAIVRAERPDLVHTHNPKPGVYGRVVARLLGVPRVVNTVHGLYATPTDPISRRTVVYGLEAMASRCSHLELVQNTEDLALMERTRLAPRGRARLLGNGIDVDRYRPRTDPGPRRRIRAELGLPPDATLVVTVGRLVAEKGIRELLAASARLDARHHLVVIGPDDPAKRDALPAAWRREAEQRGVRFLGHRADLDLLLPACDLFVLASYREGVPRAAMEAAACGLPLVATDVRGCRQVVADGVNGLLVPARRVEPLARAIRRLVTDPELRRRLAGRSRPKAVREFDQRDVIGRLFAAYAELGVPGPA